MATSWSYFQSVKSVRYKRYYSRAGRNYKIGRGKPVCPECIKKQYSAAKADEEVLKLEAENTESFWWAERCEFCGYYHIMRQERAEDD